MQTEHDHQSGSNAPKQEEVMRSPTRFFIRFFAWLFSALSTSLIIILLGLSLLLYSQSAREWFYLEVLPPSLSYLGLELSLSGLNSPELDSLKIDHLTLRLEDDSVIEIRQLDFEFVLETLFEMQLHLKRLQADVIALDIKESQADEEPLDIENLLEQLSKLSWQINLDAFAIHTLAFPNKEAPIPPLSLDGKITAFTDKDLINGFIKISNQHDHPLEAELNTSIDRNFVGIIQGSIHEDKGGWFSELIRVPNDMPLDVNLDVSSVLDNDTIKMDINKLNFPFEDHILNVDGKAEINLGSKKATIPSLVVDINGQKQIISGWLDNESLEFSVLLDQLPIVLSERFQDYLKGGEISGSLSLKGAITEPELTTNIQLNSHFKREPVNLKLQGAGNQASFNVVQGELSLGNAKLKTHGELTLQKESLSLDIEMLSGPLSIIELFDLTLPDDLSVQLLETRGSLSGKFNNLIYSGKTKGNVRYRNLPLQVQGYFNGDFNQVELSNAHVKSNGTQLKTSGLINWHDEKLKLNVDAKQVNSEILSQLDIKLPIDLIFLADTKFIVAGHFSDPTFSGFMQGDAQLETNKLKVQSNFSTTLSRIYLKSFSASGEAGSVLANGFIDWDKSILDLQTTTDNLSFSLLDQFNVPLPKELKGFGSINGHVSGGLINPSFKGEAALEFSFKEQGYALSCLVNRTPKRIEILDLTSKQMTHLGNRQSDKDLPQAELNGWLIFEPESQMIQSDLNVKHLSYGFAEMFDVSLPSSLNGMIDADVKIMNSLTVPEIEANIVSKGVYKGETFNIFIKGHHKESSLKLEKSLLEWNNSSLTASGLVNAENLDLHVRLDELNPAELNPLGYQFNQGKLNLTLDLAGTPKKPIMKGLSELLIEPLKSDSENPPISIITELDAINDQFIVKTTVNENADIKGNLDISGEYYSLIHWLLDNQDHRPFNELPLAIQTRGNVRLNWLNNFIDKDVQTVSGDISLDTTLNGSVATPKVQGNLRLENGRYSNTVAQTQIDNTNITIIFSEEEAIIEQAVADDGNNGKISLRGKAVFPNNDKGLVDLFLNLEQASLIRREDIEGDASGTVHLTGNFEQLAVKGDVHISPFQIMLDLIPKDSIPEIDVTQTQQTDIPSSKQLKLPPTSLDVKLSVDQQAYIRGRGLDAELKGFMGLTGTVAKPFYNGQFDVIRGSFELFAKKFKLEDGTVLFANDAVSMFVQGRHTSKEITFIATLSGSIDALKINLRTEPALPEDEAVSRLLFGKSIKNITPIQAIQLASAIQTLRGESSKFDPLGTARELLHVDSISVESQETSNGDNGLSMGVGKYLTEGVYVEIARTPEPSQPWKGSIEIELSPSVNLETTTGNNSGFGGVELQWKKDY